MNTTLCTYLEQLTLLWRPQAAAIGALTHWPHIRLQHGRQAQIYQILQVDTVLRGAKVIQVHPSVLRQNGEEQAPVFMCLQVVHNANAHHDMLLLFNWAGVNKMAGDNRDAIIQDATARMTVAEQYNSLHTIPCFKSMLWHRTATCTSN